MTSNTNDTAPEMTDMSILGLLKAQSKECDRLVAEAVTAALEEAINRVNGCDRVSEVQPAIRALIEEKKA